MPSAPHRQSAQQRAEDTAAEERRKMLSASSPLLAGLPLPSSLRSHSAVASILTHSPGHIPLTSLKHHHPSHPHPHNPHSTSSPTPNPTSSTSPSYSSHLGHEWDYSIDPDKDPTFPGTDERAQVALFKQALSEYRQHEKMLDINPSRTRVGQAVMTEEERGELELKRDADRAAQRAAQRAVDRRRQRTEYPRDECPVFIVGAQPAYTPTFELDPSNPQPDDPTPPPITPPHQDDVVEQAAADEDELITSFRALLYATHPPRAADPHLLYEPAVLLSPPPPPPASLPSTNAISSPGDSAAASAPTPAPTATGAAIDAAPVSHVLLPSESVLVSARCREHSVVGESMVAALLTPPLAPAPMEVVAAVVTGKTPRGAKAKGKGK